MSTNEKSHKPLPRASILLVDDEPLFLRSIKRDLIRLGYSTASASDPSIALAMLEVRHFDVVVSDLQMPMPDGQVFAVHASRTAPTTPIVVLTGEDSLRRIHESLDHTTVEAVMPKPYQTQQLEEAIQKALVQSRIRLQSHEGEARVIATGLVRALALRDIETESHSRRVAAWAAILGKAFGIDGEELLQIELGSLLHDVGKIGVPDSILRKPGKLDAEEWNEMRKHPAYGREMVSGIAALEGASKVIYGHHERWDGKGYPHGLVGKDIPIGARIFAIVDTYDAMTSDRVYRAALSHDDAVEEIRSLAEVQYDPRLVECFLAIDPDMWQDIRQRFRDDRLSFVEMEKHDETAAA
ncbi:MAG: HD domain-containing protein [Myxococcales bacterium]|nr:MAG: HD domain-containing protein [Myxococcales bacterium]